MSAAKPTVTEFILGVIDENWVVETERLVPDAMLVADLGADALDMVELDVELEDEFGIEIPDDIQSHNMRVSDYADLVEKLIAEKAADDAQIAGPRL